MSADPASQQTDAQEAEIPSAAGNQASPVGVPIAPDADVLARPSDAERHPVRRFSLATMVANLALGLLGIGFFLPLLWVIVAAVDAGATNTLRVPQLSLTNFQSLFQAGEIVEPFKNSLYLAGVATVVCTILALLAAYPLSRRRLPFKRPFLYVILFATGLPVAMLLVPVYTMFVKLHIIDSLTFTAFFLAAISLPFAVWLLKNFIDSLPIELEEAALVDGASTVQVLRYIVIPLTWPGISVSAVYTFINAWSAFLTPYILLLTPGKLPASITIYQTEGAYGVLHYGPLAAYSLLFSVPVVALYWVVARHFQGAFNFEGSLKG
jgi:multiple sugar transport system permease protein